MAARTRPTAPFPALLHAHLRRVLGSTAGLVLLSAAAGCNETTEACVFDGSDAEIEVADLVDSWYCKGGARYVAREVTGATRFEADFRCAEVLFSIEPAPGAPCAPNPPGVVDGRPLTVDGEARVAPTLRGDGWVVEGAHHARGSEGWVVEGAHDARGGPSSPATLSLRERRYLADRWAESASYEHASVASFARFMLDLLRFGAPAELLSAASVAAADEVRHAQAAYALASRFGGEPVAPGPLSLPDALPLSPDLAAFAAATLLEGCVGETLAALRAAERSVVAEDPEVVAALQTLVREEGAHAELAWRTVEWALEMGGAPVREALEAAAAAAEAALSAPEPLPEDLDPAAVQRFGVLASERERAALLRGWNQVIAPALAALLG